jgi:hypothetical protein
MIARDPAARAIGLLVDMRDELERAAFPDGALIQLSREQYERLIDSIGVIARLVREREDQNQFPHKWE